MLSYHLQFFSLQHLYFQFLLTLLLLVKLCTFVVYYLTYDDYSPAVHGQYDHILLFINLHRMDALCTTFSTSTHAPIELLDRLQSGAKIKFFFRTHLVTGMYYYL